MNSAYNAANMLTSSTGAGASTYTNDADGDTLSGGGRGETWDSQNRMVNCSFGSSTSTFKYGADGLRRQSTVNGTVDNYAYDAQSMVREMNSSLTPQATYLSGPMGPEYRRNDTQTESDGQGHTFGLTRWYVYDGLGSVVGEVDPVGNLTCADEYDVYGAVRGRTGTATTAHGFVGSLGHLSDASTGLIYMRARYYDPQIGRFASEDSRRDGGNWYNYANANPTNNADYTGMAVIPFTSFMNLLSQIESTGTQQELIALANNLEAQAQTYTMIGNAERSLSATEYAGANVQREWGEEITADLTVASAGTSLAESIQSEFTAIFLREVASLLQADADAMG
jgi:RHS repeat-associated protein